MGGGSGDEPRAAPAAQLHGGAAQEQLVLEIHLGGQRGGRASSGERGSSGEAAVLGGLEEVKGPVVAFP